MRNMIAVALAMGLACVQARAALSSFGDDFSGPDLEPWVAAVCPGGVAEIDSLGMLFAGTPLPSC